LRSDIRATFHLENDSELRWQQSCRDRQAWFFWTSQPVAWMEPLAPDW
jgi:hypothetical protein